MFTDSRLKGQFVNFTPFNSSALVTQLKKGKQHGNKRIEQKNLDSREAVNFVNC